MFMSSSLEMTRTMRKKNGSKVIAAGNFQVVHGDAFFFRKGYSMNHNSLHEPCYRGKKFKGDVQRMVL